VPHPSRKPRTASARPSHPPGDRPRPCGGLGVAQLVDGLGDRASGRLWLALSFPREAGTVATSCPRRWPGAGGRPVLRSYRHARPTDPAIARRPAGTGRAPRPVRPDRRSDPDAMRSAPSGTRSDAVVAYWWVWKLNSPPQLINTTGEGRWYRRSPSAAHPWDSLSTRAPHRLPAAVVARSTVAPGISWTGEQHARADPRRPHARRSHGAGSNRGAHRRPPASTFGSSGTMSSPWVPPDPDHGASTSWSAASTGSAQQRVGDRRGGPAASQPDGRRAPTRAGQLWGGHQSSGAQPRIPRRTRGSPQRAHRASITRSCAPHQQPAGADGTARPPSPVRGRAPSGSPLVAACPPEPAFTRSRGRTSCPSPAPLVPPDALDAPPLVCRAVTSHCRWCRAAGRRGEPPAAVARVQAAPTSRPPTAPLPPAPAARDAPAAAEGAGAELPQAPTPGHPSRLRRQSACFIRKVGEA